MQARRAGLASAPQMATQRNALNKCDATSAALKALAAFLLLGGIGAFHAAEAPENVEAEIAEAVQSCKDSGGTPNADAVLSVNDVNGDGGEDWVVDYAKLSCKGGINEMCDDDGCTLRIYLWNGAAAWNLAFDETVKSYKFAKHGRKHILQVVMAGSACDKPSSETCHLTFRLNKNSIDLSR